MGQDSTYPVKYPLFRKFSELPRATQLFIVLGVLLTFSFLPVFASASSSQKIGTDSAKEIFHYPPGATSVIFAQNILDQADRFRDAYPDSRPDRGFASGVLSDARSPRLNRIAKNVVANDKANTLILEGGSFARQAVIKVTALGHTTYVWPQTLVQVPAGNPSAECVDAELIKLNVPPGSAPGTYYLSVINAEYPFTESNALPVTVIAGDSGNEIALFNGDIGLEFVRTENGAGLRKVIDSSGFIFLNDDTKDLWEIQLRSAQGEVFPVTPENTSSNFSYSVTDSGTRKILRLQWEQCEFIFNGASSFLDLVLSVEIREGSSLSDWRIESLDVHQPGFSIFKVEFPRIHLRPVNQPDDDYVFFASGHQMGSKIMDPARSDLNKTFLYPPIYPLQFAGFCDGFSNKSIYFAAYDPEFYYKEFSFSSSGGSDDSRLARRVSAPGDFTKMSIRQMPPDSLMTSSYVSPYPVKIGVLNGDWFDVTKFYGKDFGWKQANMPKKIVQRPDQWRFAENPFLLTTEGLGTVVDYVRAYEQRLGLASLSLLWTGWHNGIPYHDNPNILPAPANLKTTVEQLHRENAYIIGYVPAIAWMEGVAIDTRAYGKVTFADAWPYFIRGMDMQPLLGDLTGIHSPRKEYFVSPGTDFWCDIQKEILIDHYVAEYDFDSFYLDGGFGTVDFDPSHGHTSGGGNYGYTGVKKFLTRLLTEGKKLKPSFSLLDETYTDPSLGESSLRVTLFNHGRANTDEVVPIIQAFAKEYAIFITDDLLDPSFYFQIEKTLRRNLCEGEDSYWCTTPSWVKSCPGSPSHWLTSKLADIVMAQGYIVGSLQRKYEWAGDPRGPRFMRDYASHYDFLAKAVEATRSAKEYTFLGEFARPLELEFDYADIYSRYPLVKAARDFAGLIVPTLKNIPPVLNSVFRSPDGSLGIFLANYNDDPIGCSFTLDFETYGLHPGDYGLYEKSPEGRCLLATHKETFTREITIAPTTFILLELRRIEPEPPVSATSVPAFPAAE